MFIKKLRISKGLSCTVCYKRQVLEKAPDSFLQEGLHSGHRDAMKEFFFCFKIDLMCHIVEKVKKRIKGKKAKKISVFGSIWALKFSFEFVFWTNFTIFPRFLCPLCCGAIMIEQNFCYKTIFIFFKFNKIFEFFKLNKSRKSDSK